MKTIHFLSNVVVNPIHNKIARILEDDFHVSCSDLNQVEQFLLSDVKVDILVVILTSKYFFQTNEHEYLEKRLEILLSLLTNYKEKNEASILLSNLWDSSSSVSFQEADRVENNYKIVQANRKIFKYASQLTSFQVLNIFNLAKKIGDDNFYRCKMDFLYQMPFSSSAINCITDEILLKLNLLNGQKRKKLCLIDGDNTLWSGILGEDGVQGVSCDQNYPGVVYWMFQKQLLELKRTGVILGLVSKNNENDIRNLFKVRSFPLEIEDFSVLMANWNPKSFNIQMSANNLNIGLDSIVFIDDSNFEIESVQMALPQVLCVQFNSLDLEDNLSLLANIPSFQSIKLTNEDIKKVEQYRQESKRVEAKQIFDDVDSYIKSLNIEIECSVNEPENLHRVVQLFNKTNQFNLTTIRYQASQIEEIYKEGFVFDFKVQDKFGDMGIVGAAIVVNNCIDNFVLSCRALGRNIEFKIIEIIKKYINKDIQSNFILSDRNQQTEHFYEKCSFEIINSSNHSKKYMYRHSNTVQNDYDHMAYNILNKEK